MCSYGLKLICNLPEVNMVLLVAHLLHNYNVSVWPKVNCATRGVHSNLLGVCFGGYWLQPLSAPHGWPLSLHFDTGGAVFKISPKFYLNFLLYKNLMFLFNFIAALRRDIIIIVYWYKEANALNHFQIRFFMRHKSQKIIYGIFQIWFFELITHHFLFCYQPFGDWQILEGLFKQLWRFKQTLINTSYFVI